MGHFPFFVELTGKTVLVVGGGTVAARKIEKLLDFGTKIWVIAPEISEEILKMKESQDKKNDSGSLPDGCSTLHLEKREAKPEDIVLADAVIAATDREEINSWISLECKKQNKPVNVVDDREKCTFFFPALVKRGALTVAVGTDGKSPVAASYTRKKIEKLLPENMGEILELLGSLREEILKAGGTQKERAAFLEFLFEQAMCLPEQTREEWLKEQTENWKKREENRWDEDPDRNERK